MSLHKNKGFTLIELLVVISIISLLSSIIMTGVASARVKALDAKRIQETRSIDTAVKLYIEDNGHAPYLGGTACKPISGTPDETQIYNCVAGVLTNPANWATFQTEIAKYMPKLPIDPCGTDPTCKDKGLEYKYIAPLAVQNQCVGCSTDTLNKSFETAKGSQQTGEVSGYTTLTTFYNPPAPSGGGGGGGGGYGN